MSNNKVNVYKIEPPSAKDLSAISFTGQQTIELLSLVSLVGLVLVLFVFTSFYGLLYMRTDNAADKGQSSEDRNELEENDFENEFAMWNNSRGIRRSQKALNCYNVKNINNIDMSSSEPTSDSEYVRKVGFSTSDDDGMDEELPLACVMYEKNSSRNVNNTEPDRLEYQAEKNMYNQ